MKKKITIGIASLVVLSIVVGVYFWYTMGKPLYEPGMVRTAKNLRAPLKPPAQTKEAGFWQVEPDIKLKHFAAGDGRNILIVHGGPGTPYAKPWQGLQKLTHNHKFHYYEQRGCGQSSRPIDKFSSANYYKNIFSKSENDLIKLNQDFAKYYMAVAKSSIPEQGAAGGWMVHAMFFSMGKKHDYRNAIEDVYVPVLVIHAADDLQSEAASRLYADTFPNARFEIIQNSGHFPFHEQPARFALVVGDFLSSLD